MERRGQRNPAGQRGGGQRREGSPPLHLAPGSAFPARLRETQRGGGGGELRERRRGYPPTLRWLGRGRGATGRLLPEDPGQGAAPQTERSTARGLGDHRPGRVPPRARQTSGRDSLPPPTPAAHSIAGGGRWPPADGPLWRVGEAGGRAGSRETRGPRVGAGAGAGASGAAACGGRPSAGPGGRGGRRGGSAARAATGWPRVPAGRVGGKRRGLGRAPGEAEEGGGRLSAGTRLLLLLRPQLRRRPRAGRERLRPGGCSSPSDPAPASARGGSEARPRSRFLRERRLRGPPGAGALRGGWRPLPLPSPPGAGAGPAAAGSRGKVTARQFPVHVSCAARSSR